jgi:ribosome-associated translation inhibitor RaiA
MQVTVETDNHIENRDRLIEHVEGVVRDAVDRHEDRISFVEAHLGDVNGAARAGAADMRCMLQARIAGLKSVAVEHRAETLHLAIEGAAEKLTKALETTFGKLEDRERRAQGTGEASADAMSDTGGIPHAIGAGVGGEPAGANDAEADLTVDASPAPQAKPGGRDA